MAGRVGERVICEFGLDTREVQDVGSVLQLVNGIYIRRRMYAY